MTICKILAFEKYIYFSKKPIDSMFYLSFNNINTIIVIKPEYNYTITTDYTYTISSIIVNYGFTSSVSRPNTYPNGGIFEVFDTSSNKTKYANTSFIVNNNTGIISINNNIDVGNYIFIINYIVNQVKTSGYFNLFVIPNIIYYINEKTLLFDTSGTSIMPEYSQKQGKFTIYNNNNNVFIDSSGIIYFTKGIDVGTQLFLINYNLNNISNQTIYTLNVLPKISYLPNTIYILYQRNSIAYSEKPNYKQLYGTFTIKDYIGELVL